MFVLPMTVLVLAAAPAFDPGPWLGDLDQTQRALAEEYANLEWAVFEREADLPRLFADARSRLKTVSSDLQARAVFDWLARRIGDGHVDFRWPEAAPKKEAPGEAGACSKLGYDASKRAAPLAAHAPGYVPLETDASDEFPAGIITVAKKRVGVIKVGLFSPQGFPGLCEDAKKALSIAAGKPCDDGCAKRIAGWASDRLTADLATQLRALQSAGAQALVVDVAGNGGGSEWAEAAVRMMTPVRLKSQRVGFVRGAHWAKNLAEIEADLRAAASGAKGSDAAFLTQLVEQVVQQRREALSPCDSAPLWRGEHPKCQWLGQGSFSSGLIASADPAALRGKAWAKLVFSPMQFPYEEGIWRGPLMVLVDGGTASAAEQFAAVLQDNQAAVILGAPTLGAGCGHTNGGTPTTLRRSRGVLEMPDCVRFRADGSNEVMGIQPDILIGLRRLDGPHRSGLRFAAKLPEALERASAIASRLGPDSSPSAPAKLP